MASVDLKGVSKRFGGTQAIHDVDLACESGRLTVLLGHSGAGKTTLLRLIAGLETVDRGAITVGDTLVNELPCRERQVSMAFESYALYPSKTVFDNMAFSFQVAARRSGVSADEARRRVHAIAELLEIEALLDRLPYQLSGGQRQRVALGRALVRGAAAHLLDEPIAHLDAKLRHRLRGEIKHLQKDRGRTTVWSTPDQLEAMSIAEWIAIFRDGVKVQEGTPLDLYERPKNRFVAGSLGDPAINFFDAEVEQRGDAWHLATPQWTLPIAEADAAALNRLGSDRRVILGMRPSDIAIHRERPEVPAIEGEVLLFEPLGSYSVITAQAGVQQFKVKAGAGLELGAGARAWFVPEPGRYHFFHPETGEAL
ncbi:MAG: ABC transporter ATP-binding protein [Proteobacteria bacterium]|nr:ABC transporter ATP-binding protein [Pseudomonadota bacterium]